MSITFAMEMKVLFKYVEFYYLVIKEFNQKIKSAVNRFIKEKNAIIRISTLISYLFSTFFFCLPQFSFSDRDAIKRLQKSFPRLIIRQLKIRNRFSLSGDWNLSKGPNEIKESISCLGLGTQSGSGSDSRDTFAGFLIYPRYVSNF